MGGLRPMTPTSEIGSHRLEAKSAAQAMSRNPRLQYPPDDAPSPAAQMELRRSPATYHRDTVIAFPYKSITYRNPHYSTQDSSLYARLSSSPRLAALLRDERVLSAVSHSRRMHDEPIDDQVWLPYPQLQHPTVTLVQPSGRGLDSKSNLLLGLFEGDEEEDSDADKIEIRRYGIDRLVHLCYGRIR